MNFLKNVLSSCLGVFLAMIAMSIIGMIMMVGVIAAAFSDDNTSVKLKPHTILTIDLEKPVDDRGNSFDWKNYSFSNRFNSTQGLDDIVDCINDAAKNDNVDGIFLKLSTVNASIATLTEIRSALKAFKKSGKFIYCYAEDYSQTGYYLGSVSDQMFMNPMGVVLFKGMAAQVVFIKDLLDKVGVEPQIFRHGTFKSAVEPLMLNKMSEANREQTLTYIQSIWQHIVNEIAASRNLTAEQLNEIAENLSSLSGDPQELGMIDSLFYEDQLTDFLCKATNAKDADDLNLCSTKDYINSISRKENNNKIAIIYASGDIVNGKGDNDEIGATNFMRTISKIRKDDDIKAVVLRINSPGGSASASEYIWRELTLLKAQKPVVVSMGDYAASGGYYIASASDCIVAQPTTITGSIGVFGVTMNAKKLMNDKLGITSDEVKTHAHADAGSIFRPFDSAEKDAMQHSIEKIYSTFIKRVADNRNLSTEYVDSIAQGRVWTGSDALQLKLVDKLGGLNTAIQIAAQKANLKEYSISKYPHSKNGWEQLSDMLNEEVRVRILPQHPLDEYINLFDQLYKIEGIQARLPYWVKID